jgi:hypothetical protein
MLARVLSAAVNGIEACLVEVEVDSGWGPWELTCGPEGLVIGAIVLPN